MLEYRKNKSWTTWWWLWRSRVRRPLFDKCKCTLLEWGTNTPAFVMKESVGLVIYSGFDSSVVWTLTYRAAAAWEWASSFRFLSLLVSILTNLHKMRCLPKNTWPSPLYSWSSASYLSSSLRTNSKYANGSDAISFSSASITCSGTGDESNSTNALITMRTVLLNESTFNFHVVQTVRWCSWSHRSRIEKNLHDTSSF